MSGINAGTTPQLALREWSQWSEAELSEAPQLVKCLAGGLTNRTYLLHSSGRQLVLRLNAQNSQQLALDRNMEALIWRSAAAAGLAPALLYADPQQRYMVSEYLAGTEIHADNNHAWLSELATLLRRVHQLRVRGRVLNIHERAEHYWRGIVAVEKTGGESEAREFHERLRSSRDQFHKFFSESIHSVTSGDSLCLCHNDPVLSNIIRSDSGLRLIDWEYAAMGDPFFDLAAYGCHQSLTTEASVVLLDTYCDGASANDRDRFNQALIHYQYLDLLWSVLQQFDLSRLRQKLMALLEQMS